MVVLPPPPLPWGPGMIGTSSQGWPVTKPKVLLWTSEYTLAHIHIAFVPLSGLIYSLFVPFPFLAVGEKWIEVAWRVIFNVPWISRGSIKASSEAGSRVKRYDDVQAQQALHSPSGCPPFPLFHNSSDTQALICAWSWAKKYKYLVGVYGHSAPISHYCFLCFDEVSSCHVTNPSH